MDLPFRTLLYRFYWFDWLFRDVNAGSVFEWAAVWRHNKSQARWLPLYMRRHLTSGVMLLSIGWIVEQGSPVLSAFFYVPGALAVPTTAVMAVAWIAFQRWD